VRGDIGAASNGRRIVARRSSSGVSRHGGVQRPVVMADRGEFVTEPYGDAPTASRLSRRGYRRPPLRRVFDLDIPIRRRAGRVPGHAEQSGVGPFRKVEPAPAKVEGDRGVG